MRTKEYKRRTTVDVLIKKSKILRFTPEIAEQFEIEEGNPYRVEVLSETSVLFIPDKDGNRIHYTNRSYNYSFSKIVHKMNLKLPIEAKAIKQGDNIKVYW